MELVAHRGANWHFPENTLSAFRRALQDGATILEMDVHRTKDDVIVVCHDPIWRGRVIYRTDYEILSGDLPRLEDVLLAFPNAKLNVDIKQVDVKTVYFTVELIRRHHATGRVCLTSFSREVHRCLYELNYEGERGLSRLEIMLLFFLPLPVMQLFNWRGRRAQVPLAYGLFKFANAYFVDKCHKLAIWVDFWVVNDRATGEKLLELGADRVMTDDPATLVSLCSA